MTNVVKIVCVAVMAAAVGAAPLRAQDSGIEVGTKAPIIKLANTAGQQVSLADVIGKKPVLLEFWATWCEVCRAFEPRMMAAYKKYGNDVAFYGIAVAINETLPRVQKYVADHKYPYTTLWDKDGAAAGAYDVAATSFVVLIGKSGKVVYTGVGSDQDLDAAMKKAR